MVNYNFAIFNAQLEGGVNEPNLHVLGSKVRFWLEQFVKLIRETATEFDDKSV